MKNYLKIRRWNIKSDVQTMGQFSVIDERQTTLFNGYTLELPDKGNQKYISRIPAGTYTCKKRRSLRFPYKHFIVLDVPNRSYILGHRLNTYKQTKGCIGFGLDLGNLNRDGYIDILYSKLALQTLIKLLPDTFELQVFDAEPS